MGKLTAKQEAYCKARARGLTQKAAYREAYDCARMKDTTVYVKASELEANGNVAVRIRELRNIAAQSVMWDLQDAARPLMEIIELAMPIYRKRAAEGFIDNKARLAITESIRQLNEMFGIDGTAVESEAGVTIVDDL